MSSAMSPGSEKSSPPTSASRAFGHLGQSFPCLWLGMDAKKRQASQLRRPPGWTRWNGTNNFTPTSALGLNGLALCLVSQREGTPCPPPQRLRPQERRLFLSRRPPKPLLRHLEPRSPQARVCSQEEHDLFSLPKQNGRPLHERNGFSIPDRLFLENSAP